MHGAATMFEHVCVATALPQDSRSCAMQNPYSLEPAIGKHFVGRKAILDAWRERLTLGSKPWMDGKSWILVGPGGMGKTSLLRQMQEIAQEERNAWAIFMDLGFFRELDSPSDMFETIQARLPPAQSVATRMRQWFGLSPSSDPEELVKQVARVILRQAVAFSPAKWGGFGVEISGPTSNLNQPEGLSFRIARLFNDLAVLSEEQDRPIAVLVDQVGKVHDSPRWRFIAAQLLSFVERLRKSGTCNVIFVLSFRPERKGKLEWEIRRELFDPFLFDYTDLHPLSHGEAVKSVVVRGGAYIPLHLAKYIVDAVSLDSDQVEPYAVQLAAMAVWAHINPRGQPSRSPTSLSRDDVLQIVRDGHARVIEPVQTQPVQWKVLQLLAHYPAGLNVDEIFNRLQPNIGIDLLDVKNAVDALNDQSGYRVLVERRESNTPSVYSVTHDLLRSYILSQIPEAESRLIHVRRLVEYGVLRFHASRVLFTKAELDELWEYRSQLEATPDVAEAIIASSLELEEPLLPQWLAHYQEMMNDSLTDSLLRSATPAQEVRFCLGQVLASSDRLRWIVRMLKVMSIHGRERVRAADTLIELGYPEIAVDSLKTLLDNHESWYAAIDLIGRIGKHAIPVLEDLSKDRNYDRRHHAARTLAKMEDVPTSMLTDFISYDDAEVRLECGIALVERGKPDIALPVLAELTSHADDSIRLRASTTLLRFVEPSKMLPVLSKVAEDGEKDDWRIEAANAMAEMGEAAIPNLTKLAEGASDEKVRTIANQAMARMGQSDAVERLAELAKSSESDASRRDLVKTLSELDTDISLILNRLIENAPDDVRIEAARAIAKRDDSKAVHSTLVELSRSGTDIHNRVEAARALLEIGDIQSAQQALVAIAGNDEDRDSALEAVAALSSLGETAVAALEDILEGSAFNRVFVAVARALAGLDKTDLAMAVLRFSLDHSDDNDYHLRHEIAGVMIESGCVGEALPLLREVLQGDNSLAAIGAADTVFEVGEPALPLLVEYAKSYLDGEEGTEGRNLLNEEVFKRALNALATAGESGLTQLSDIVWQVPLQPVGFYAAVALGNVFTDVDLSTSTYIIVRRSKTENDGI